MKKILFAFGLVLAVLGSTVVISAIASTHRSLSHWRVLSPSSVV
jgi:hypothetical protein